MKKFKKKFKKFFKFAVFAFAVLKFFVDVADVVELFKKVFLMVMPICATLRGLEFSNPRLCVQTA